MKRLIFPLVMLCVSLSLAAQELKTVTYRDGTQKLNGLLAGGTAQGRPGILVLPAWKGIDEEARTAALELARQGYAVFIADIFGEGNIPADNAAAAKIATAYKTDYQAYQKRIALALEQLVKAGADKDKLAVIGYCFGGTGALESARASLPVQGVVSIHGGLAKAGGRANGPLSAKILVEHPADDKSVTPEDMDALIREMNEGNADWQIITYAHAKHTFTDPRSPDYNEVMARRAWKHTLLFLEEILK